MRKFLSGPNTGSSPLARGTQSTSTPRCGSPGLIPARAGNTPRSWHLGKLERAHPRSRGEHRYWELTIRNFSGSSPLARGTLLADALLSLCRGLIPARAGNTGTGGACGCGDRAHPRSRGEHTPRGRPPRKQLGSSPLARGTPPPLRRLHAVLGLIPARAGNTGEDGTFSRAKGAHPRSRGEHCGQHSQPRIGSGSSPLARGTQNGTAAFI